MKKYIAYFTLALTFTLGSCNNEFDEEVYTHYIGLKSILNSEGTTNVYMRYEPGGKSVYELPVIVAGSTVNAQDLDVHIAVDPDTLAVMNEERYKYRTDLYYQLLDEKHYKFLTPTCHIPAGESVGLFNIEFDFTDLDLRYKWVLPLTIEENPSYLPNPRKNYRKAFLRVMPFNDYSGVYGATTMNVKVEDSGDPFNVSSRTFYVVDENTCFFYAGVMSEEHIDREKYKVLVTFNDDGTLYVRPEDPENNMGFQTTSACTYTFSTREDETQPNIVHEYTTITMSYNYYDFTSHVTVDDEGNETPLLLKYSATGTYTMERKVNTSIPDRDQAIQW